MKEIFKLVAALPIFAVSLARADVIEFPVSAIDLAVSASHVCYLDEEGKVFCASPANVTPLVPPDDLLPARAITVGDAHACAVLQNMDVQCWGDNFYGQIDVPAEVSSVRAIDAGQAHTCAVTTEGTAICWGLADNDRLQVPANELQLTRVSAGRMHACAIDDFGDFICWGADGQFDNLPEHEHGVYSVSAGRDQTCLLDGLGNIHCYDMQSSLPNGRPAPSNGPYEMISAIDGASGGGIICALNLDDRLECTATPIASNNFFEFTSRRATEIEVLAQTIGPLQKMEVAMDSFVEGVFPYFPVNACGIRPSGSIVCWSLYRGEEYAGFQRAPHAASLSSVSVFSSSAIELNWQVPNDFIVGEGFGSYELFRDGEFHRQVFNRGSFFDTSLVPGLDYLYQIRAVSIDGVRGELSEPIQVNTASFEAPGGNGFSPVNHQPAIVPSGLTALVYGPSTLELRWERPSLNIVGYEIYLNGEYLGLNRGTSQMVYDLESNSTPVFTVAALLLDGQIVGTAHLSVTLGDTEQCR